MPSPPALIAGLRFPAEFDGSVEQERFAQNVAAELEAVGNMLLEKNTRYGDAALRPLGIFGPSDAATGIRVRIDDKLKRIQTSDPGDLEDAVMDLLGYLILLRIAEANPDRKDS